MGNRAFGVLLLFACTKHETAQTDITIPAASTASASTAASTVAPVASTPTPSARGVCPQAPPGKPQVPSDKSACGSDADCKEKRNGRCKPVYMGHGVTMNACTYDECMVDGDCKVRGTLCLCAASQTQRNACMTANCHDDADCPGTTCGHAIVGQFCHGASDGCKADGNCGANEQCGYDGAAKRWVCQPKYYPPPG